MEKQSSISLNKYISSTGICSRREADNWIEEGRVAINGEVARKGNRVVEGDEVTLDGKLVGQKAEPIYIALNKPPGVTCTTDLRDEDNIIDYLDYPKRIFPIGRLDKASSGLIFLTNVGDIVNPILREENEHEKEYVVQVDKPLTEKALKRMSSGMRILGTKTKPCKVELLSECVFRIILTQGLNRQIRRMCGSLSYKVVSLKRIRIMNITLEGDLEETGQWRYLTEEEVNELWEKVG